MWTVISETGVPPLRADTKISHEAARSVSFPLPLPTSLERTLRSVISKLPAVHRSNALHALLTNSCGSERKTDFPLRNVTVRSRPRINGVLNNHHRIVDKIRSNAKQASTFLHKNFRSNRHHECINTLGRRWKSSYTVAATSVYCEATRLEEDCRCTLV